MKSEDGFCNPSRDAAKVLYIIRKFDPQYGKYFYLTIEGFDPVPGQADPTRCEPEGARVAWIGDRHGASEWLLGSAPPGGNNQVILKKNVGHGAHGGWRLAGGWVVGLDAAGFLMQKHGGILVPVRRKTALRAAA